MSPILFFIISFYLHRCGKNIFTNKFSSSGIYRYFNSSVRRVNKKIHAHLTSLNWASGKLTETEEESIHSHAIDTEEKGCNCISSNNQNLKGK